MKKFVLLLTSVYMAIMGATSAVEAMIASGVASGLMPLLKPIAEKTLIASIDHAKGVVTGATCPFTCRGPTGVPCKVNKVRSSCKQTCQKVEPIEGYKIKIRFGKDWNLVKCVEQGIKEHDTTALGKGNPKSIAIYTQQALDDLLTLLAIRKAARQVANVKGIAIEDIKPISSKDVDSVAMEKGDKIDPVALNEYEKVRQKGETLEAARTRAVKVSKDLIKHIDASIRENILEGIYGDQ